MQLPFQLSHLLLHIALNHSSTGPLASSSSVTEIPCPFSGQIYPPPTHISSSPIWQDAVTSLKGSLASIPSLANNESSVAIQVVSLHDSKPLFEHYTKAPTHRHGRDGLAPVDGDTVFRVASVSKMFTVYALLLKCGFTCFEDPIGKYVPELAGSPDLKDFDPVQNVDWSEITVGALASQISGIGRDYAAGDLASMSLPIPGDVNLPEVDPSEIPQCGADPIQPPCSKEESIRLMLRHAPNFPTEYTPSYSNMAFQLLGYVLENITGQSYDKVMTESVFEPLNLRHTTSSTPDLANGILKPGDPMFTWDLGDATPGGGIYSSTHDLATYARSLLNNTQLSPSQTRRWLKPHSHTSLLQLSFGSPWEILRLPGLSPLHTIDLYTKSGSLGAYRDPTQYTTLFALLPDLEVAVVVNSYSADVVSASAGVLAAVVEQHVLQPLYDIAKAQAVDKYAGTYYDYDYYYDYNPEQRAPHVKNSTFFRVSSDDQPGLTVTDLVYNGTDILALLRELGSLGQTVRLYPTTLSSSPERRRKKEKTAFRATILSPAGQCITAFLADGLRYAGIGLDLVVFDGTEEEEEEEEEETGGGGRRVCAVDLPALRVTLRRLADHDGGGNGGSGEALHVQQ